jgi:hypothetical protein
MTRLWYRGKDQSTLRDIILQPHHQMPHDHNTENMTSAREGQWKKKKNNLPKSSPPSPTPAPVE